MNEALGEALRNPEVGPIDIGDTCQTTPDDEDCAMKALAFKAPEESPAEVAERLVKFLKEVRKRKLETGVSQPLGVIVNYKLTTTGYRGHTVHVRWELHRQGGGGLPHDWLKRQRPGKLGGGGRPGLRESERVGPAASPKRAAVRPLDRRGRGRRAAGPIQHAQVSVGPAVRPPPFLARWVTSGSDSYRLLLESPPRHYKW